MISRCDPLGRSLLICLAFLAVFRSVLMTTFTFRISSVMFIAMSPSNTFPLTHLSISVLSKRFSTSVLFNRSILYHYVYELIRSRQAASPRSLLHFCVLFKSQTPARIHSRACQKCVRVITYHVFHLRLSYCFYLPELRINKHHRHIPIIPAYRTFYSPHFVLFPVPSSKYCYSMPSRPPSTLVIFNNYYPRNSPLTTCLARSFRLVATPPLLESMYFSLPFS